MAQAYYRKAELKEGILSWDQGDDPVRKSTCHVCLATCIWNPGIYIKSRHSGTYQPSQHSCGKMGKWTPENPWKLEGQLAWNKQSSSKQRFCLKEGKR